MRYIISTALTSIALTGAAWAEVPRVVADIPPVHSLVSQVMGDLGAPELLLERGASEHDMQLRPSQAGALSEAALVVWIGPELTPAMARAMEGLGNESRSLALLAVEGTHLQDFAADGAHDGHAHEGHDHGHGAQGEGDHTDDGHAEADGHAHEGTDPHAWLDPANARLWLGAIAEHLAAIDPANAATYRANAAAAQASVDALDAGLAATLAPVKDRPAIVFHDAYGYFADHYGLMLSGSILLGDATPAGAARLAKLRETVEGGTVACVFPEAQHDAAPAAQLAEGTGARLGGALDPAGSMLEAGPGLYAALMTGLAGALSDCLSGA